MPKRTKENRTIEVILLVDDKHLGEKYEQVRVAPSFARNVLIPQKKAVLATPMYIHNLAAKMKAAEDKRAKKASSFDDLLMKIQHDGGLHLVEKMNEKWHLYGKVGEDMLVAKIKEVYGIDVDTHYFKMKKKLAEVGEHIIPFQYRDMQKTITVVIKGEMDKAVAKKVEEQGEKGEIASEQVSD